MLTGTRLAHALREQLARLGGSLRRRSREREIDEEIEAHLALLSERFMQAGMSPEEARLAARKQFGGVTQAKSEWRDRSRFPLFETILQDSAYILRQLRKSPLFALSAILTLALGIGATTAIFSLVDQLILRLLPIRDPGRVVLLSARGQFYGDNMGTNVLSYPMYEAIRDRNQVFSLVLCRRPALFTVTTGGESAELSGELVSGNYFPLLGVRAAAGRLLHAGDDLHQNEHPYAVISYAYWQTRFAGDSRAIGRKLLVNNYPLTIVGVTQPGFNGLEPGLTAQIFTPVSMTPALFPRHDFSQMFNPRLRWLNVYGRLKPGMSIDRAQSGLQPLFHDILRAETVEPGFAHATPDETRQYLKMWLDVMPGGQGNQSLRQKYEKPLWLLLGVTGFVLLIACANLASLLAARAAVRQKEIAVRLAIGSTRARIVQQLVTESLLLAGIGGAAGVGLAIVLVKALLAFLPENATGYDLSSSPDARVLLFALGLSFVTGVLFGLIPALGAMSPDVAETLKAKAASVTGGAAHIQLRKILVAAQITLALLLLIGAGLFIRSLAHLRAVDPGFQTQHLVQFEVNLASIGYTPDQAHRFCARLEERLAHAAGVESAGISQNPVLAGSGWASQIKIAGRRNKPGDEQVRAFVDAVSPGYFQTLGIRLLAGRGFLTSDTAASPRVVVVSRSFEKFYFGEESAVGRYMGRGYDPSTPTDMRIVGVMSDIDSQNLKQQEARQIFLCAAQSFELYITVYVRARGDERAALTGARRVLHEMEPRAPVIGMMTVEQQLDESLVTERLIAWLSTGFTILAVSLAVLGLYGVMAYLVTQRAREIGIRVALGAQFGNVVWLVMREVVVLVVIGIALGVPLALGLGRLIQSQLFAVKPADPPAIAAAALLLSAVALAAGFLPARRAAAADPLRVLRYE